MMEFARGRGKAVGKNRGPAFFGGEATMTGSQAQDSGASLDVAGASVDVADYIDQQPVGVFQIKLLLTCAAVLLLDGFDTTAIGFVAPSLAKEWG